MNVDVLDEQVVIDHAGLWFLSSGIQEVGGGVARYFLSDRRQNAPISTEITGYAASTFIQLFKTTGEKRYLDAAELAAEYLVSQWDSQLSVIPFEPYAGRIGYSYFFDTGIIARGLLAVWRVTGDPTLLNTARECGNTMRESFFDGHRYAPVLTLPDLKIQPYDFSKWSQGPGCYQLKAGLVWYELFEIDHDERNLTCYQNLLALSLEGHSTFLPGSDNRPFVMDRLHAYLYFLEGLLPVVDDDLVCADAFVSGIEQVGHYLESIAPEFLRADVLAQYLRIRLYAESYGITLRGQAKNEKLAAQIQEFQSKESDPRLSGGFWFGRKGRVTLPFMNPWVTGFCCQALAMWSNPEERNVDWHSLI